MIFKVLFSVSLNILHRDLDVYAVYQAPGWAVYRRQPDQPADSCIYTLGIDKLPFNHQLNVVLSPNNDIQQNWLAQLVN